MSLIYELEIKKHPDGLYEWMLVRLPDKISEGWSASLTAVLLSPIRRRLIQASDRLAVTVDGLAVGIYPASVIDDDADRVTSDIVAILRC